MATLKINKKDIFRIDIVDENNCFTGKYIELNLADIELPFKIADAMEKIQVAKENTKLKTKELNLREDVKGKYLNSKNAEDIMLEWRNYYIKIRDYFDSFLGKGACQNIFGDSNYAGMEDDLFEALMPSIEQMDLSIDNMYKRIEDKYKMESIEML